MWRECEEGVARLRQIAKVAELGSVDVWTKLAANDRPVTANYNYIITEMDIAGPFLIRPTLSGLTCPAMAMARPSTSFLAD